MAALAVGPRHVLPRLRVDADEVDLALRHAGLVNVPADQRIKVPALAAIVPGADVADAPLPLAAVVDGQEQHGTFGLRGGDIDPLLVGRDGEGIVVVQQPARSP